MFSPALDEGEKKAGVVTRRRRLQRVVAAPVVVTRRRRLQRVVSALVVVTRRRFLQRVVAAFVLLAVLHVWPRLYSAEPFWC